MTQALRCAIYSRVSSHAQKEQGTIASQREALIVYATAQGWDIAYNEEDDGFTGQIDPWERPALSRLLGLADDGAYDVLLVIDVDRVARDDDAIGFPLVRKALTDAGVQLATPKGIMDFVTPEQRFQQNILSAMASFEKHKIKERTTRGRRAAISHGKIAPSMRLPTGYAWDAASKRVVIDEPSAALVREVFRLVVDEHKGINAIVRDLRARDIKSGRTYRGEHIYLSQNTVRCILKNDTYATGRYNPGYAWDPEFTTEVPTLLTPETFAAANALYGNASKRDDRRTTYDYLLRGMVRCAGCGRAMRAHSVSNANLPYYRCADVDSLHANAAPCPSKGSLRADEVDAQVWSYLANLLRDPDALRAEVQREMSAATPDGTAPDAALNTLDAEIRKLDEARGRVLRLCRDGFVSEDEARAELTDLDGKRKPLLARRELLRLQQKDGREALARVSLLHESLARIAGAVDGLDFAARRRLVELLVEGVTLDPKTHRIEVRCVLTEPGGSTTPPPSAPRTPRAGGKSGKRKGKQHPAAKMARLEGSGTYAAVDSRRAAAPAPADPSTARAVPGPDAWRRAGAGWRDPTGRRRRRRRSGWGARRESGAARCPRPRTPPRRRPGLAVEFALEHPGSS